LLLFASLFFSLFFLIFVFSPQCHHARAAHSLVNFDIFHGLRRRLDEELQLSERQPTSSSKGAAAAEDGNGDNDSTSEVASHEVLPQVGYCRPQALLAQELPGVDAWDDGGVVLFTTNGEGDLPAARTPLHPISRLSPNPERKLLVGLQLSHLLDLIMFPQEQTKQVTRAMLSFQFCCIDEP